MFSEKTSIYKRGKPLPFQMIPQPPKYFQKEKKREKYIYKIKAYRVLTQEKHSAVAFQKGGTTH